MLEERSMDSAYARYMVAWENRLCFRATDRVIRPFEWGVEFARAWPVSNLLARNGHSDEEYLAELNQVATKQSDAFYGYTPPGDFQLDGNRLTFTSAVETPWRENNRVQAQWFPALRASGRAVLILPHWNAPAGAHNGLARGIQKLGISALRLSLPYHDFRMPRELNRADYAVSSNVGRINHRTRQVVSDDRACVKWVEIEGYDRMG